MGRTEKLVAIMVENFECEMFIKNNWNCLYNKLAETPASRWSIFDEVAGIATLDWLEYKGLI